MHRAKHVFNPRNLPNPLNPRFRQLSPALINQDSKQLGLCWFVVSGERHAERAYYYVGAILEIIVNLRINETLQIGAVGNSAYRVGLNAVRLETAPHRHRSVG